MTDLFIHEKVMLNDWALPQYPHLKDVVGQVVDERRLPPFGRRIVTRWPVGTSAEFHYMQADDIRSAERAAAPAPATIRAISLWQPWASLVAWEEKKFETRHWPTDYRGLLAIHAAKRWTKAERETYEAFKYSNNRLRQMNADLPLGAMVCLVRLVNVWATEDKKWDVSQKEQLYGNWHSGRYAWELQLVEVFEKPISTKGAQGFFNWTRPAAA